MGLNEVVLDYLTNRKGEKISSLGIKILQWENNNFFSLFFSSPI
jgi:hypothetical protein